MASRDGRIPAGPSVSTVARMSCSAAAQLSWVCGRASASSDADDTGTLLRDNVTQRQLRALVPLGQVGVFVSGIRRLNAARQYRLSAVGDTIPANWNPDARD